MKRKVTFMLAIAICIFSNPLAFGQTDQERLMNAKHAMDNYGNCDATISNLGKVSESGKNRPEYSLYMGKYFDKCTEDYSSAIFYYREYIKSAQGTPAQRTEIEGRISALNAKKTRAEADARKRNCTKCTGIGFYNHKTTCPRCSGTGKGKEIELDCSAGGGSFNCINGKRFLNCSNCKGVGSVEVDYFQTEYYPRKRCNWCRGKGGTYAQCGSCKGTPKKKSSCDSCGGDGKELCSRCNGRGTHKFLQNCDNCRGNGFISTKLECSH